MGAGQRVEELASVRSVWRLSVVTKGEAECPGTDAGRWVDVQWKVWKSSYMGFHFTHETRVPG